MLRTNIRTYERTYELTATSSAYDPPFSIGNKHQLIVSVTLYGGKESKVLPLYFNTAFRSCFTKSNNSVGTKTYGSIQYFSQRSKQSHGFIICW